MIGDSGWDGLADGVMRSACAAACQAGDSRACWAICAYCKDQLGAVVGSQLRTHGLYTRRVANDIIVDSMSAAVKGYLGGFRGDADVCTYIAGIGKMKVLEHSRSQSKNRNVVPLLDYDAPSTRSESWTDSPAHLATTRALLDQILAGLSDEDEAIAVMKWVYGLTDREIGDRLRLAEGTVSARVSRLRRAVQAKYTP